MKVSSVGKRIISCVLSLCLVAVIVPSSSIMASAEDYKQQLTELSNKYEELEKQQKKINNDINKAKSEKEKQLAQKNQLSQQIELTKGQISVLENKISILTDNINEKQSQIETKGNQIDNGYELFTKRVRAMYMSGETSTVGLIVGVDNFSELLTRMEVLSRISKHDTEMLENLVDQKKTMEEEKRKLDEDMAELDSSKEDMQTKKTQLDTQVNKVGQQLQDIAALEAQFQKDKQKLQKELSDVQKEIDKVYDQINSVGDYIGGIFTWPVPGFTQVSSNYGWRFNNSDYHTGIDITGASVYGKNIVAANTGTVAFVQTSYVAGRGYGKYLIIDHGGGITTLYGHTSDIYVKVGDKVSRGQAIAAVGSTGWSTGPHLHFEVRVNKKHVTPWSYLGK